MKYFSMFSGIGGFELGIQQAYQNAWECVGYSEIDKYAIKIYERHFKHKNYGDATKIDTRELPDFDLLVGGFPCQAFSIAGKRKGFNDTRGTLFFDIVRIAKDHQPMFMLLENVKGLISHDGGKTLGVILEALQQLGYYVNYEVHNSKNFGVPQNRERIFFLCTHIKSLLSVGQNKKITTSERIIQEWLFQILLNNLKEVQKVQGTESKDWVLGYLLCREISQNPELKGENILDGIITPMGENISLFRGGEVWQNIDIWLSKNLAEGLKKLNKSTILTEIKRIIESKTYTFSEMFRAILFASVLLRKYSNPLWNEVLSSLILIQEDTKYERINNKAEKGIITESGTLHLTNNIQDFSRYFIIGHLGGKCRRKVFPIGESHTVSYWAKHGEQEKWSGISSTIDARYGALRNNGETYLHYIGGITGKKDKRSFSQGQRVYETNGISSTLVGNAGGLGGKTGLYAVRTPLKFLQRNQKNIEGDYSFTVDGANTGGIKQGMRIRRLTPTECERLQGFPDNWTKYGSDGQIISDTKRYKVLGNAVTTNVVQAIIERL